MHEIKAQLNEMRALIDQGLKNVDIPSKKAELEKLNEEIQAEGFWDDSTHAQEVSQKAANLQKTIDAWESASGECDELLALLPEISPENDPKAAAEYRQMVDDLAKNWRKLEVSTFLSGKYDENDAIMTIHAGTGGTDAADFAEMLLRMYLRYAERMGHSTEIIEKSEGDEAGIKSVMLTIKGDFAYGYLHNENGVHRLVRLSPFNSKNTRETSFVMVEVVPVLKESQQVAIKDEDLRVDVFRAGGHGGQSVNTTDSAVRITHLPTNIVVQCQNERSQLQNKEQAMKVLQAKLADLMEKEKVEELEKLRGGKTEIAWGNQIRSYVLHPYKMVKDHRTGHEESDPEKVLDGEIDAFIEAELKRVK